MANLSIMLRNFITAGRMKRKTWGGVKMGTAMGRRTELSPMAVRNSHGKELACSWRQARVGRPLR